MYNIYPIPWALPLLKVRYAIKTALKEKTWCMSLSLIATIVIISTTIESAGLVETIHPSILLVRCLGANVIAHAFHVLFTCDYEAGWVKEDIALNAGSLRQGQRNKMEDVCSLRLG